LDEKLTREVLQHVVDLERALEDETRKLNNLLVLDGTSGLQVSDEKGAGARNSSADLVLEFFKDDSFHIQDLKGDKCRDYRASQNMETMQYSNFDRTSSPAYARSQIVNEIYLLHGIDFIILRRDQQGHHPNKLKL